MEKIKQEHEQERLEYVKQMRRELIEWQQQNGMVLVEIDESGPVPRYKVRLLEELTKLLEEKKEAGVDLERVDPMDLVRELASRLRVH